MAHRIKTLAVSLAVRLLNWLTATDGTFRKILRFVKRPLLAAGRVAFRYAFVPVYAVAYAIKRSIRRLISPAKNRFMFVMANRLVVHVLIISIATVTSAVSLRAKEVRAQNLGEQSMLYKLVRGQDAGLIEEVADTGTPGVVSYFDPAAVAASADVDDLGVNGSADLATIGDAAVVQPNLSDTDVTPSGTRTKTETYVVVEGDTLSTIARQFGVSIDTILWENNLTPRNLLRLGQSLVILPTSGVSHTVKKGDTIGSIAARYGVSADDIIAANKLASADDLHIGEKLVVPGGQPPAAPKPVAPPRQVASVSQLFSGRIGTTPRGEPIVVDTKIGGAAPPSEAANASTRMIWPTAWHVITQYYGLRHTGVDIDGDYTTPIYAAESGVVIHAGWGRTHGGYGYYVEVNNGGGIVTRYGHASKIYVGVGDQVTKGQTIAMVGTTGRSTGTHLHFEVIVNGKFTNPLQWIR